MHSTVTLISTGGEHVYSVQLQEIANRERRVLQIAMDDILDFRNDDDFAGNIERNTSRYVQLFEEVADGLLPESLVQHSSDIFDILKEQRSAVLASGSSGEGAVAGQVDNDTPAALMRRFQVSIVPKRSDKVRRIREVRASDIGSLVIIKGVAND